MEKKLKLKKGDLVQVIAGKEKGKQGKVLEVHAETDRIVIEGLNIVKKTIKKTQENPKGGITTKEAPVHISNVMYFDAKANKVSRIGFKVNDAGRRVRFAKASGTEIESKKE